MNKRPHKRIVISMFTVFLLPLFASAQELPRLEVTFTPDPLFSEQNILPGDNVSGTVEVTNNSGEPQQVITEAINVSDVDELSKNMFLTIKDDDSNTFFDSNDGTFFDFLTSSELTLTPALLDGDSVNYTFTVDFLDSSGNDTQKDELGFDLCVGFFDDIGGMNCGDTVVSGEGDTDGNTDVEGDGGTSVPGTSSGGGGAGPFDIPTLQIFNERVVDIDDVGGQAIIAWDTNLFSTSEVVYGLTSGGPYSLDPESPNFGYPETTGEDLYKVVDHAMLLTGLVPGAEYNFRVVSRASPPTVSFEHDFKVEKLKTKEAPVIIALIEERASQGGGGGGSTGSTNTFISPEIEDEVIVSGTNSATTSATTTEDIEAVEEEDIVIPRESGEGQNEDLSQAGNGLFAAAFLSGLFDGEANCILFALFNALLIYILHVLWTKFVGNKSTAKARRQALLLATLASVLFWILGGKYCVAVLLALVLAYLIWSLFRNDSATEEEGERIKILHKTPLD